MIKAKPVSGHGIKAVLFMHQTTDYISNFNKSVYQIVLKMY